ncbi:MAG: methyltransferase [Bacteroidia bacterium]|nr:methyltransferase [Bacteroidia bacterium]
MGQNFFRFRNFIVYQNPAVFKVSTESVLLGAWTIVEDISGFVLDVGTGTGLLSLMMIQKGVKNIVALDIDFLAIRQTQDNFFKHNKEFVSGVNISVICEDFMLFAEKEENKECFDLVLSNPPYFSKSLKSTNPIKNLHKHSLGLSFKNFILGAYNVLKPGGKLCFICPQSEEKDVLRCIDLFDFKCTRRAEVIYKPNSTKPTRVMFEFIKNGQQTDISREQIRVYESENMFSELYKHYVKEFYDDEFL